MKKTPQIQSNKTEHVCQFCGENKFMLNMDIETSEIRIECMQCKQSTVLIWDLR